MVEWMECEKVMGVFVGRSWGWWYRLVKGVVGADITLTPNDLCPTGHQQMGLEIREACGFFVIYYTYRCCTAKQYIDRSWKVS